MTGFHVNAFFEAVEQGGLERVQAFRNGHPTLASAKSSTGESAMLAAAEGREDIAGRLIKRGADVGAKSNDGKTPRVIAEERGRSSLVPLFSKPAR